jgi:hypothetical protein
MVIICSYCKITIGHKEPLTDHRETHGICKPCMKTVTAEIDEMVKAKNRRIEQWKKTKKIHPIP